MIHPIGREIIDGVGGRIVQDSVGIRHDIEDAEIRERGYTESHIGVADGGGTVVVGTVIGRVFISDFAMRHEIEFEF